MGMIRLSSVGRIGARWPGKTVPRRRLAFGGRWGVRKPCAWKHCFSLIFSLFRFFYRTERK